MGILRDGRRTTNETAVGHRHIPEGATAGGGAHDEWFTGDDRAACGRALRRRRTGVSALEPAQAGDQSDLQSALVLVGERTARAARPVASTARTGTEHGTPPRDYPLPTPINIASSRGIYQFGDRRSLRGRPALRPSRRYAITADGRTNQSRPGLVPSIVPCCNSHWSCRRDKPQRRAASATVTYASSGTQPSTFDDRRPKYTRAHHHPTTSSDGPVGSPDAVIPGPLRSPGTLVHRQR